MRDHVRYQVHPAGMWTAHAYVERICAAFGSFTRDRVRDCLTWEVGLTFWRYIYCVEATTEEAELWLMLNPPVTDTADLF